METRATSAQAKDSIKFDIKTLEALIHAHIFNICGATCDEIEVRYDMRHQTASARITALQKKGIIYDSGQRRKTRSGRSAIVWAISNTRDKQMYMF